MRASALMMIFAVVGLGCTHYEPPKSPADEQKCKSHDTRVQVGEWITVLGALTLAGSGIAYAASPSPTQNVSTTGTGTQTGTITDCNGPNCSNGRPMAVGVGAAALGVALLGLALTTGEAYAFNADGCGNASPPSAPMPPTVTDAAPTAAAPTAAPTETPSPPHKKK